QFLFARDAVEMVLETPPRKGRPGRELTRLVCRELVVHTMDGVVVSLTAEGAVVLTDAPSQTVVRCDRLFYAEKDGGLTLLGDPAQVSSTVEEDTRFTMSAQRIVIGPDGGWFRAMESVVVAGVLPTSVKIPGGQPTPGRWIVHAKGEVYGVLGGTGPHGIKELTATEQVRATGPHGQALRGDKIHYVASENEIVLTGKPASIRDGDIVGLAAPKFVLGLDGREISRASTTGAGTFFYKPGGKGSIREWRARLQGSARLADGKLTLADGVVMDGFDRKGVLLARITAPIVIAYLPRGPREEDGGRGPLVLQKITGSGNADTPVLFYAKTKDGPVRVRSDEVVFEPGPSKVTLRGNVEVDSDASPHKSVFEWISFILTEEGVDEIEFGPTTILKRRPD
ncbi:MAG: hypothetical protein O7C98_08350, partial [Planctomycetota bacterium]|nr:hypothetical protein [Planctomycetota bacterium]